MHPAQPRFPRPGGVHNNWGTDIKTQRRFDHFPEGTGYKSCFFIMSADTKMKCAFKFCFVDKKYKKYNYLPNLKETLAYNCSKVAAERGNRDILSKATF